MPLFGGKNNKFKVDPPKIRVEKVTISRPSPKPTPPPSSKPLANGSSRGASAHRPSPRPSPVPSRQKSNSPYPSSSDEKRLARKRKAGASGSGPGGAAPGVSKSSTPSRPSPVSDRVEFDKDSDNDNEDDGWMNLDVRKRQRKGTLTRRSEDPNRKLKSRRAFDTNYGGLKFVHAVDVASLECKCVPVMGAQKEDVAIELQYPSFQPREKYASLIHKRWELLSS
jgi:[histone H3]-lysine79 N-trimethyltransferase